MKGFKKIIFCLIGLLVFPALSWAWQGKVVGVSDGDTITVLHDGQGEKIRLYGIDTPEKRQDFGKKAKQFTSKMVFGKIVKVVVHATDRYGRTVGLVYCGKNDRCLNEELVKHGLAWVYIKYCSKPICDKWRDLEEKARQSRIGLWQAQNPMPPWTFRHTRKRGSSAQPAENITNYQYHGNISSKIFHKPGCR